MKQNSKLVWEGSFFNKMIKKTFLIYWSSPSWFISTFKPSGINWWKPKCTGSEMRHYLQIQLKNIRIHSILTWRLLTYKEFVLTEVNLNKGCQLKNVLTGRATVAYISERSRNSKHIITHITKPLRSVSQCLSKSASEGIKCRFFFSLIIISFWRIIRVFQDTTQHR